MNDGDRRHFNALGLSKIKSGDIGRDFTRDHAAVRMRRSHRQRALLGEINAAFSRTCYRLDESGQHRRDQ